MLEQIGSLYDFVAPKKQQQLEPDFQFTELITDKLLLQVPRRRPRNKTTFDDDALLFSKGVQQRSRKPSVQLGQLNQLGQYNQFGQLTQITQNTQNTQNTQSQVNSLHRRQHQKLFQEFQRLRDKRNSIKFSSVQLSSKNKEVRKSDGIQSGYLGLQNRFVRQRNTTDLAKEKEKRNSNGRRLFMSENKNYQSIQLKLEKLAKPRSSNILMPQKSNIRHDSNEQTLKTRKRLSDWQRIQFEACLSWTKKHNKIGDFYLEQLGKSKQKDILAVQAQKRRSVLLSLKRKYDSEEKQQKKNTFFQNVRK